MERASNFGGYNESAYSSPIFGWLFIITCIWSIYLIRNTSVMVILRRSLLWIYGQFIIMINSLYKNAEILIYKLNRENHKKYIRMSSRNTSAEYELPDEKR
jgi:hypothetical protein